MISEKEYWEKWRAAQEGKLPKTKVTVEIRRSSSPAGMQKEIERLEKELEIAESQLKRFQFENACLEEENAELSRDAESWRKLRAQIMEEEHLV